MHTETHLQKQATSAAPIVGEFYFLADAQELEPHGQFTKWLHDHDILVYRDDGQIKAVSNICPHFGGPIGYHKRKEGKFTCLWHSYQFSTADGRCTSHGNLKLREYKLKLDGSRIMVQLVEKS